MEKSCAFDRFGVMLDCSRNAVMNVKSVKRYIDILKKLGYNSLLLYTEDTYEVENQPFFGHLRGRFSTEELKDIGSYAEVNGIELIPCIQTLAHLDAIFKWEKYMAINDIDNILLVGDDETYKLIDDMFKAVFETFKSKTVIIGMDEAWRLGHGKYFDKNGFKNRSDIMFEHLKRVSEIAKKYDFHLLMYSDMYFNVMGAHYLSGDFYDLSEARPRIPDNVEIIYWDYYSKDKKHYDNNMKTHKTLSDNFGFAGGLWCWSGFVPHNQFSIEANIASLSSCLEYGVKNVILTLWGDDGNECSKFALLPSLYYASALAHGETDAQKIKDGFKSEFGISFDDFMLLDLPSTPECASGKIANPAKVMLYNDCFLGKFDCCVKGDEAEKYSECAEKLRKLTSDKNFGYLFESTASLCELLKIKYGLGVRTRKAYLEKDRKGLENALSEFEDAIEKADKFYAAFRKQWLCDYKPQGFEIQDIRLGGVICRLKDCKLRLTEYLNGETESIPELEEPVLCYNGRDECNTEVIYENRWWKIASAGII